MKSRARKTKTEDIEVTLSAMSRSISGKERSRGLCVGDEVLAGTILALLPSPGVNRSVMLWIRCRHCGCEGSGGRRSAAFRNIQKSCGCLKKLAFIRIYNKGVADLTPSQLVQRFETASRLGKNGVAAMKGPLRYELQFAWRAECKRLDALSLPYRLAVYQVARHGTRKMSSVTKRFGLTRGQITRICFGIRRAYKAILDQDVESGLACEPNSPLSAELKESAKTHIKQAVAALRTLERGRYPNEFTRRELGEKTARYRWLFETLRQMRRDDILTTFGVHGLFVLESCQRTLINRERRRKDYMTRVREADITLEGRPPRIRAAKPNTRSLRKPRQSPEFIANTLSFDAFASL